MAADVLYDIPLENKGHLWHLLERNVSIMDKQAVVSSCKEILHSNEKLCSDHRTWMSFRDILQSWVW